MQLDPIGDLLCFSHLRWDFVYQRPQHLLSRCAKERRVFFIEEPIFEDGITPHLSVSARDDHLMVAVPRLPRGMSGEEIDLVQRRFVDQLLVEHDVNDYSIWFYTPMALPFARHLTPRTVIFDCMDELSAFKNAPAVLKEREQELLSWSHVVFTGGQSLYEAREGTHPNVHAFPSSVDVAHFSQARSFSPSQEPEDQASIPGPRLGFFGVIDERMDIRLIEELADARPNWHLVMLGPVVKIDPALLPMRPNIHFLGSKSYAELPRYIAGWDIAILPFAKNESTRFISPTKTPEYLAAGKSVISTSITDVVRPYGQKGLVHIADSAEDFVRAAAAILGLDEAEKNKWSRRVDEHLGSMSWDETWQRMVNEVRRAHAGLKRRQPSLSTAA